MSLQLPDDFPNRPRTMQANGTRARQIPQGTQQALALCDGIQVFELINELLCIERLSQLTDQGRGADALAFPECWRAGVCSGRG